MRKLRKKFKRPKVSWDSDLIRENKKLSAEYGLRRQKEILISHEILRGFRQRARQLIAEGGEEKERTLMEKLAKFGLLAGEEKELDDVLALDIRNVLNRRLQTLVFRKGLATSPLHARQLIVHGHIRINGRGIKFPSYLVTVDEENSIESRQNKPKPKKAPKHAEKAAKPEAEAKTGQEEGVGGTENAEEKAGVVEAGKTADEGKEKEGEGDS